MSQYKTQIRLAGIMTSSLRQIRFIFVIVAIISFLCLLYTYITNTNIHIYRISGEISRVKYASIKAPNLATRSVYDVITSGYLLKSKNVTMKFNKTMATYNHGTKGFSVSETSAEDKKQANLMQIDDSANDIKLHRYSNHRTELDVVTKGTTVHIDSENTTITLGADKRKEVSSVESKNFRIEKVSNKKSNGSINDKRFDNLNKEFVKSDNKTADYSETKHDGQHDELKLNTTSNVSKLVDITTITEAPKTLSPIDALRNQVKDKIIKLNAEDVASVREELRKIKNRWKNNKKKTGKYEPGINHSVPEVKLLPPRNTSAFQRIKNHLKHIVFNGNKVKPFALPSGARETLSATGSERPDVCKSCFENNFEKLVNEPTLCDGNVDLLILITSTIYNSDKRASIRKTWGNVCNGGKSNIKCLFVFGTKFNEQENELLQQESKKHNDIIQFNFYDTYANLTYKTLSSIQWSHDFCPQAKYIMKTDDDMYVNTELLPLLLKQAPDKEFIGGMCWGPSSPHRDTNSKWYVSFVQYKHSLFPSMCSGTGYVMSRDVADGILRQSPNVPFFYLEDVYVAICVKKLNIKPILVTGFKNTMVEFNSCEFRNRYITVHGLSGASLEESWKQIQTCPLDDLTPSMVYSGYAV